MSEIDKEGNQRRPDNMVKHESTLSGKQAAREILLLAIRMELNPEEESRLAQVLAGKVDWEYLIYLAGYHNVTPLVAYNLAQGEFRFFVPESYFEKLERIYQHNICRNMLISEELTKVLSAFKRREIEVINLKGIVLAEQLYVNHILRTTTDIDILVTEERIPEAISLVREMGYAPSTRPSDVVHPFHRVFHKNRPFPLTIELHWDIYDSGFTNTSISDVWRRAQVQEFIGGTTLAPSPEDNLIYIASNLLTQDGHRLKYLGDISGILKIYQDNLDWTYIIKSANYMEIKIIIYYSLEWSCQYFDTRVPSWVINALKPGLGRRCLIGFVDWQSVLAPIRWGKLRLETAVIVKSLMMRRIRQSLNVLSRYRADGKNFQWLRTIIWIPFVFGTATLSYVTNWLKR